MPDWQAEAIILSVRPHGEGSAILSVLTADYGRHAGLFAAARQQRCAALCSQETGADQLAGTAQRTAWPDAG